MIKFNDDCIDPNISDEELCEVFEQESSNAKEWAENQAAIRSLAPNITDVSLNNRTDTYALWLVTMRKPGVDKERSEVCFTTGPHCTFGEACAMLKGVHTPEAVEALSTVGKEEVHTINQELNQP